MGYPKEGNGQGAKRKLDLQQVAKDSDKTTARTKRSKTQDELPLEATVNKTNKSQNTVKNGSNVPRAVKLNEKGSNDKTVATRTAAKKLSVNQKSNPKAGQSSAKRGQTTKSRAVHEDNELPADEVKLTVDASEDDFQDSDTEDNVSLHPQNTLDRDEEAEQELTIEQKKQILEEELERDLQLKQVFYQMVKEKAVQEAVTSNQQGNNVNNNKAIQIPRSLNWAMPRHVVERVNQETTRRINKSPSDSTLYMPALAKLSRQDETRNVINKISNFVEGIRLESETTHSSRRSITPAPVTPETPSRVRRVVEEEVTMKDTDTEDEQEHPQHQLVTTPRGQGADIITAQNKADNAVIDAELFRASLVAPKGMLPIKIDQNIELLRNLDSHDDFFHVSCHVEPVMKEKIERGEFVDLEKLLPKDKGGFSMNEDQPGIQLLTCNGSTFLTPQESEKCINNIRRWDQAFRVYATIFTRVNPDRSSEIWQYVHVIHTAANTYSWTNVAMYDFMFRRLMATKLWRSWAKTYTQGWNLALKEPAVRANNYHNSNNSQAATTGGRSASTSKGWKDDCCWHFNKNRCKEGSCCKYDHRCTYCGLWNHSFLNCRKRAGKKENNSRDKDKPKSPAKQQE